MKRDPDCTLCSLHEQAQYVCLLGSGPTPCDIMGIGEAPGEREDDSGQAFVGRAGRLLDTVLNEVGIDRKEIYITNAVHCRPPENRKPRSTEIESCFIWLMREIRLVKPKYLLIMGGVPLEAILGRNVKITQERGKPFEWNGITCYPTYHPSYILRNERESGTFKQDLANFAELSGRTRRRIKKSIELDIREVLDVDDLEEMCDDLSREDNIGGDFETSQLSPYGPEALPISFGASTSKHQWVMPIFHPRARRAPIWDELQPKQAMARIVKASKGACWIGQNWKFDNKWMILHLNCDRRVDFDVMLAHYNLDENSYHDLELLAERFLDESPYDVPLSVKQGKSGTWEEHAEYLAKDVCYLRPLKFKFEQQLREDPALWRLFQNLTMPLARMLVDVELRGVYLDLNKLDKARDFWTDRMKEAENELKEIADINWGSTQQVAGVFFDQLKLKPLEKTDSGKAYSTNESVLKRLSESHKAPRTLLRFREAKQQLSHFLNGWIPHIYFSRLHPNFKIHGTDTGRLSCDDPNLQQVPRDPRIRSLISAPKGWLFFKVDLSQIELRIAAHMANERTMKAALNSGEDLHWKTLMRELMRTGGQREIVLRTASKIAGQDVKVHGEAIKILTRAGPKIAEKVDPKWKELRKRAKAVNFGYLFGMWWKKFIIYARDNYDVIVTAGEAKASRVDYFELYPDLKDFHKRQKRFVKTNGFVRSLFGRKRRLPIAKVDPESPTGQQAQRQAINAPVQSCASDWNVCAAIEMHQRFSRDELCIVGLVHDEVIGEVRADRAAEILPEIQKIMQRPRLVDVVFNIEMTVPIEAELEVGPWASGIPLKQWLDDQD